MSGLGLDRPAIVARSLAKTYESGRTSVPALRGVSIDIRRGEVTLLRGPSGSGKTTLLSVFGCILSPDHGELWVGGQDVLGLDERRLAAVRLEQIGFVFQSFNLFPTLRAWENVAIALDLRGMARRKAWARALVALGNVGLFERRDALPAELSGGQKQRVAIARAIAGEPSIILADEPTAALDGENGRSILGLLRGLATEDKRAVVIVTHDERATEFADRIVTISDGRISEDLPASLLPRMPTPRRREPAPPDGRSAGTPQAPQPQLRRFGT